jgi:hypothetical protein
MRLLTFFFISVFGTVQACVVGGGCLVFPGTAWLQLEESYTGLRPVNTHKFLLQGASSLEELTFNYGFSFPSSLMSVLDSFLFSVSNIE